MRGRLHPLRQNPEATHCPATRSLRSHTGLPGGGPAVPGVPGARCENKATSRISRQTAQSRLTSTSERGGPRTALPRARDVLFSPHRASEDSPWPQSVTRLQPHSRPAGVCTNASWARRRTHARHRQQGSPVLASATGRLPRGQRARHRAGPPVLPVFSLLLVFRCSAFV